MKFTTLAIAASSLNLADARTIYTEFDTKITYHDRSNAHLLKRGPPQRFPEWNYANATTPDATSNGLTGVIFEPDLVEGKPGKDGAQIKKTRIGPITIPAGATLNRPVTNFPTPCTNCLITAIQLGLEYADGKRANVDSGAWYTSSLCFP